MNSPENNQQQDREVYASTSSSLVARAGQIMIIIIALALLSMISSMLVSESLSGDAAQINRAGALRMQAMRISRAHVANSSSKNAMLALEVTTFENKLNQLFSGGLTSARKNPEIEKQYQKISILWQTLKNPEQPTPIASFDQFVVSIDQLVTLLQINSEKKLDILRLIQGTSLFAVLIVASVVLFKLHRLIVLPLKQLVYVASEVGQGHFNIKAQYNSNDELGVLARTINQMASELESTYTNLEDRVAQKTHELTRINHSLEVLYRAARDLATQEGTQNHIKIVSDLEQALGIGSVSICRESEINANEIKNNQQLLKFPLQKQDELYGYLLWRLDLNQTSEEWQTQLLQAMADIIATAIELKDIRNAENRLIIVEERAVIARELHDSLAQSLSYLKVQVSLLNRKMQKQASADQINETLDDIKQGISSAYVQLRELLTTFRLKLDDPSIENALKGTISEFTAKCHHPVLLDFALPQNHLSANQEIHVLQIVREALSNVQRHANATQAGVYIATTDDKIQVRIWDDGQGIPEELEQHGHFGLAIMHERARSLNALIDIQPNRPKGTQVCVEFEL